MSVLLAHVYYQHNGLESSVTSVTGHNATLMASQHMLLMLALHHAEVLYISQPTCNGPHAFAATRHLRTWLAATTESMLNIWCYCSALTACWYCMCSVASS
jgi:hypothetical protein